MIPERVLTLAIFFGAVVAWVTDHLPEGDEHTNVPCWRSPQQGNSRERISWRPLHEVLAPIEALSVAGRLKYSHLYFTKPHYNSGLVVSASFSTDLEDEKRTSARFGCSVARLQYFERRSARTGTASAADGVTLGSLRTIIAAGVQGDDAAPLPGLRRSLVNESRLIGYSSVAAGMTGT